MTPSGDFLVRRRFQKNFEKINFSSFEISFDDFSALETAYAPKIHL